MRPVARPRDIRVLLFGRGEFFDPLEGDAGFVVRADGLGDLKWNAEKGVNDVSG